MSCTQSATFMSSLEHLNSAIKKLILKTTWRYSVKCSEWFSVFSVWFILTAQTAAGTVYYTSVMQIKYLHSISFPAVYVHRHYWLFCLTLCVLYQFKPQQGRERECKLLLTWRAFDLCVLQNTIYQTFIDLLIYLFALFYVLLMLFDAVKHIDKLLL